MVLVQVVDDDSADRLEYAATIFEDHTRDRLSYALILDGRLASGIRMLDKLQ